MGLTRVLADSREPGHPWQLPLVLRHAALCRLALPNFCLKLNLKEKKKKNQPKTDKESRISFLLDFSPPRGEGGGGVRDERRSPSSRPCPPGRPGGGAGAQLDLKPAAHSLVSAETKPQTDAA